MLTRNCRAQEQEWVRLWGERLRNLLMGGYPSGAGLRTRAETLETAVSAP